MNTLSIAELLKQADEKPLQAYVDGQLQKKELRETKSGKPYQVIHLVDALNSMSLKVWENHQQYQLIEEMEVGTCIRIGGKWTQSQWGLDASGWDFRLLNDSEKALLFSGDASLIEKQANDWRDLMSMLADIQDPRLSRVCQLFIDEYGETFRRAAAARRNHHARRGGLVEHSAQMMRAAWALCSVYPDLNRDLLTAGVLFHDCGKMWENNYPEDGFTQPYSLEGELMGHIPLGLELVSKLWAQMEAEPAAKHFLALLPENAEVRMHLLHLIASHHGAYEWGSPTLPRTPEAYILHHVDNIDAKYEMMMMGYEKNQLLAPNIQERQFPLPAALVKPLDHFASSKPAVAAADVAEESIVEPASLASEVSEPELAVEAEVIELVSEAPAEPELVVEETPPAPEPAAEAEPELLAEPTPEAVAEPELADEPELVAEPELLIEPEPAAEPEMEMALDPVEPVVEEEPAAPAEPAKAKKAKRKKPAEPASNDDGDDLFSFL